MKSKKLENNIQDYLEGNLNENEFLDLTREYSPEEIERQIKKSIEVDYLMSLKYKDLDVDAALADFRSTIKTKRSRTPKVVRFKKSSILRYAAIFIGIVGIGYFFAINMVGSKDGSTLTIRDEAITLQMFNHQSKTITSGKDTEILDKKGNVVAVQQGNKIIYSPKTTSKKLVYNEINIPYGKTFEVQLSDGTEVHLNSGSSLRYPVNFGKGRNREVFITGEAYFHVAHDVKHPFIVNAGKLNVRVLGTKFDVSSYKEDDNTSTVLVSGSVELYQDKKEGEDVNIVKLSPGKMAKWNHKEHKYQVGPVDTSVYTAWMRGKLLFKDEPFKEIRKKLERHYNVVIINHNKLLESNTFSAEFDTESIEKVMEIFDKNFGINYKIENNKIIIHE